MRRTAIGDGDGDVLGGMDCETARFVTGVQDGGRGCWAGDDGGVVDDNCARREGEVPDAMADFGGKIRKEVE